MAEVDLVALAATGGGITTREAAVAMFGSDSSHERHMARHCLLQLCDEGRLVRVRSNPSGFGSVPDRFYALGEVPGVAG